jgi:hypothetical protein
MKNKILTFGIVLISIAVGFFSALQSSDVAEALFKFTIVSSGSLYVFQRYSKFEILTGTYFYCTPLVGLKRKCNKVTMGGIKRLYLVLTEDLLGDVSSFELALSTGEFNGSIPLKPGKKFVEIEAWYDTSKIDGEMKSGSGFTQGLEFKVLGYDKDIVKLKAMLYETPVNVIAQGNDNQLYYLGQKYIPLMFDAKLTIPEKGTARKEVTFSTKQDGFTAPVFPLNEDCTFEVTPLAA